MAKPFDVELEAVNWHHDYVTRENHFGQDVLITRKGGGARGQGGDGHHPGSFEAPRTARVG